MTTREPIRPIDPAVPYIPPVPRATPHARSLAVITVLHLGAGDPAGTRDVLAALDLDPHEAVLS